MNNKQDLVYRIIDAVLSCCAYERKDGTMSVTKDDILSSERIGENADMTRCIVVRMLIAAGYTKESIADFLGRSKNTISDMLSRGNVFEQSSAAYRIAYRESTDKCRAILSEI